MMTIVCNSLSLFFLPPCSVMCVWFRYTTLPSPLLYFYFWFLFDCGDGKQNKNICENIGRSLALQTRSRLVQSLYNLPPTLLPSISVLRFRLIQPEPDEHEQKKKSQMTKQNLFLLDFIFSFLDSKRNKFCLTLSLISFPLWNIIIINSFCYAIKSVRQFFPSLFFSFENCSVFFVLFNDDDDFLPFIVQPPHTHTIGSGKKIWEMAAHLILPPFSFLPHDCTIPSLGKSTLCSPQPPNALPPPPFDQ